MQDPLQILYKVSKNVEARIQQLAVSVTSGNVDNFEQYRYIIGQINALELIRQDISNLLNEKEQKDEHKGTVYPFEAAALEPALKAARLYPRGALWYAHAIIQKAAGESVNPPISRRFVENFVQTGQKPPVEEEDTIFELPSSATDLQAPST